MDCTPLLKVQSLAYLAHLVHMPRRMEQLIVIRVVMMDINPIRVLQIVCKFKKDFIVQEQQRKWNVQRVKEETVVVKLVNNATKEDFKKWLETPHVLIVLMDGIIQDLGRLVVFQYLLDHTH